MRSLPKHPTPKQHRKSPKEWLEHFRAERDRWSGQERTKAYRFRNAGRRYR